MKYGNIATKGSSLYFLKFGVLARPLNPRELVEIFCPLLQSEHEQGNVHVNLTLHMQYLYV